MAKRIDEKADARHEAQLQKAMFQLWVAESGETNQNWIQHLNNCIGVAIQECLTPDQKEALSLYMSGYNQLEIAKMLGIDKSSVSRRVTRGIARLFSRLKYATPMTLHAEERARQRLTRLYRRDGDYDR